MKRKKPDSPQKPPTRDIFLPGFLDEMQGSTPDPNTPAPAQDAAVPPPAPGESGRFDVESIPPETVPEQMPSSADDTSSDDRVGAGDARNGEENGERRNTPPDNDDVPPADNDEDAMIASEPEVFDPRSSGPLARVMDDNFLQFASYSICDRAIPTVEDGLKPVQRRILHTLSEMDDGRFIKVATVVGRTMFYHPHGDQSIYGALVNLANKRYLIEGQGNFGNIYTGDAAAAPRYIECRLTDLAREEIFNPKTTQFIPSYDGRNKEPVFLPAKLPLLLMLGANGIAVGMSTLILPHNFIELLQAEIELLQNPDAKPVLYPDFPTGGLIDCTEYEDGNGRILSRARFETHGTNQLILTELPFGQTTEAILESIEKAARAKKVPVKSIHDATADHAEIVITLLPGTDPERAKKQLYAATNCELSVSANMTVLENNRPRITTVSEVLRSNVRNLLDLRKREFEIREGELLDEQHRKTLVQIFVEERIYKRIEKSPTAESVREEIYRGFKPFAEKLVRPINDQDIETLLAVPIRRISLFDINRNREEIEGILKELAAVRKALKHLTENTIDYLKGLIKKYQYTTERREVTPEQPPAPAKGKGKKQEKPAKKVFQTVTVERFPRLTQVETFTRIDVRAVTASKLEICYDPETGFMGNSLRGIEPSFSCSSLDKILILRKDGRYRVIPAPEREKVFVDKDVFRFFVFNRDQIYTCVYTETEVPFTCLKRFSFGGVILNKDYELLPEPGTIRFFEPGTPPTLWIKFRKTAGLRILQKSLKPEEEVAVKGVRARGKQITTKVISAIDGGEKPPRFWDSTLETDKGSLF